MNDAKQLMLDSVVFVALLKDKDEFLGPSEALVRKIAAGKVRACASVISLLECAYVLRRTKTPADAIERKVSAIASLGNVEFLPLSPQDIALGLSYARECRLDLSDAIIVASMVQRGIEELVTEDEYFRSVPFVRSISIRRALEEKP